MKAVIFDFDGVLCQTERYFLDDRIQFFRSIGLDVQPKELSLLMGGTGDERAILYDTLFSNQKVYLENREQILKHRPLYIPHKELRTEGIIELLEILKNKNIKLAVASNSSEERLHRVLHECEIHHYFDAIVHCTKDTRKPKPDVYLEAIRQLDVTKDECMIVEDSKIGIQAGKNAGIKVLALKDRDGYINQSEADVIIVSIQQVLDYL